MTMARDIEVWPEHAARPRTLAPTREQIEAINDVDALRELEEAATEAVTKIETNLEFGDGDDAWAARARGALSAHKIARTRIRKRIHKLVSGEATADAAARATRAEAHARLMEQQAEASRTKKEQAQIAAERHAVEQHEKTERHRLAVLDGLSWLRAFHQAAKAELSPDQLRRVSEAATEAQSVNAQRLIEARGI